MFRRHWLGAVALAALSAACGSGSREPAPAQIAFGRDECEYCRMPIDDPRLAAQYLEATGRAHKFGEPGCLANWIKRAPPPSGTAFVADAEHGRWLPAAAAASVAGRVRTPMAYDVVAYGATPVDVPPDSVRDWPTLVEQGVSGAAR